MDINGISIPVHILVWDGEGFIIKHPWSGDRYKISEENLIILIKNQLAENKCITIN